jgi:colicin import membrane protein
MTDETIDTAGELITIPHKTDVPALFAKPGGIEGLIQRIEKEARAVALDTSTDKGRTAVKSLAAKVSRSKTLIDEVGKEQNEEANKIIKANNALRKLAVERLDALRDEIKAPVLAWGAAEAERVRLHLVAMDAFDLDRVNGHSASAEIAGVIASIEAVEVGPSWEEYEADARAAKAAALVKFQADLGIAQALEAQAAELEALRVEKAKREAEDAARLAKEAAAKAEAERAEREAERIKAAAAQVEAKAKADAEAAEARFKAAEEQAQRDKAQALVEAERRATAAAQAERDRIAAEKRAEDEAAFKRAADKKHRQRIRSEIVEAITKAKPANWEELVDAMIAGEIPHVKVAM